MSRNAASALAFAAAVAAATVAAAIVSSNAFADDVSVDNAPSAGTRSQAEAQAELMRRAELVGVSGECQRHHGRFGALTSTALAPAAIPPGAAC